MSHDVPAREIRWLLAPVVPHSSGPLLRVACDALPTVQDDLTADVLEQLALTVVERDEALKAQREILLVALHRLYRATLEITRLERRVRLLLQERRTRPTEPPQ